MVFAFICLFKQYSPYVTDKTFLFVSVYSYDHATYYAYLPGIWRIFSLKKHFCAGAIFLWCKVGSNEDVVYIYSANTRRSSLTWLDLYIRQPCGILCFLVHMIASRYMINNARVKRLVSYSFKNALVCSCAVFIICKVGSSDQHVYSSVRHFQIVPDMMTSWNGNIFLLTGPLCGEFTGYRWIPLIKASDAELW